MARMPLTAAQIAHADLKARAADRYQRFRDALVAEAREIGISDPAGFVDLSNRTAQAEKCGDDRELDPVTSQVLTARELMSLVGMGDEFSRRRGYTESERAEYAQHQRQLQDLIVNGKVDIDSVQWLEGVISGQLNYP